MPETFCFRVSNWCYRLNWARIVRLADLVALRDARLEET